MQQRLEKFYILKAVESIFIRQNPDFNMSHKFACHPHRRQKLGLDHTIFIKNTEHVHRALNKGWQLMSHI